MRFFIPLSVAAAQDTEMGNLLHTAWAELPGCPGGGTRPPSLRHCSVSTSPWTLQDFSWLCDWAEGCTLSSSGWRQKLSLILPRGSRIFSWSTSTFMGHQPKIYIKSNHSDWWEGRTKLICNSTTQQWCRNYSAPVSTKCFPVSFHNKNQTPHTHTHTSFTDFH